MDHNNTIEIMTDDDVNVSSKNGFTCITVNTRNVFDAVTKEIASDILKMGSTKSDLNRRFQSRMHNRLISNGFNEGLKHMQEELKEENNEKKSDKEK